MAKQKIQKQARLDKKRWLHKQIDELVDQGKEWKGVQLVKKKYTPKACTIKELGAPQPVQSRPDIQARHFKSIFIPITHTFPLNKTPIHATDANYNTNPFDIIELENAITMLKNNRAPGPDEVPNEMLKYLDDENRHVLLRHINKCNNGNMHI